MIQKLKLEVKIKNKMKKVIENGKRGGEVERNWRAAQVTERVDFWKLVTSRALYGFCTLPFLLTVRTISKLRNSPPS